MDIGLLVFIKTLKNPIERSVEGVSALARPLDSVPEGPMSPNQGLTF